MADATVQTGTIHTKIPGRLDRLPWAGFHWKILIGLGTVWILDGLEVTMVGTVAARITQAGSGLNMTAGEIGIAGAIYIVGACLGALFFGHLTDRFGRKKLFMLTLGIYIAATCATAFSMSVWWFFAARFFTGSGIGGEYAAINSAIDELIPARMRGRADILINGTFWLGSAFGSGLALVFLNEAWFAGWLGWRLAFGVGVVLGLGILLVRRNVPESPRWLFIHGRQKDAESVVECIEHDIVEETGQELDAVDETLTVRQRKTIPFRTIATTAFKLYPGRAVLGIALFIGQAFIYNGITFNIGTLFSGFYGVSASFIPIIVIIYAVGNLLGPLTLGRLFDTVGRKPMISGTYIASAVVAIPLGLVFLYAIGGMWFFLGLLVLTFFLASAGASAAYLTVSEIFPMETRAMAIALFYAIGTAAGGIAGPLLFGQMIGSGVRMLVMIAFFIGAVVMALGGVAEIFLGVKAEGKSLESIAQPLTAAQAEEGESASGGSGGDAEGSADQESSVSRARSRASEYHEGAERSWARAAELRAEAHGEAGAERSRIVESLVEIETLRAQAQEQQALAADELADPQRPGFVFRAQAAEQRARGLAEQTAALEAENDAEADQHRARAEAAAARARSREQLALAEIAEGSAAFAGGEATLAGDDAKSSEGETESSDGEAGSSNGGAESPDGEASGSQNGAPAAVTRARALAHRAWSAVEEERAAGHDARATGDAAAAQQHEQQAKTAERRALAAEERIDAAEHAAAADAWRADRESSDDESEREAEDARRRQQEDAAREERITQRLKRRQDGQRGPGKWRPGSGTSLRSAWSGGTPSTDADDAALDREIEMIARALEENGTMKRRELSRKLGARYWWPGRFGSALDNAIAEGRVRRLSRGTFDPVDDGADAAAGTTDHDSER